MDNRFKNWASDYEIFETLIDENDTLIQQCVAKIYKGFGKKINSRIFDLGCGTGNTALELLKLSPDIEIILNDLDLEMINIAKKNLKFFKNCTFKLGDCIDILKDEKDKVNAIISVLTIHNIPKNLRYDLLGLIFEKINKGGLYINGDKLLEDKNEIEYLNKYENRIDKLSKLKEIKRDDLFINWSQHEKEDLKSLDSISDHIRMLEKVGFKNIRLEQSLGLYSIITAQKL